MTVESVTILAPDERVAYMSRNCGAYARMRLLDAALVVQAPQDVDDAIVAALFLKGLTAQALVEEVEPVKPGMFVLAQAPGGGVGQLVARMAKLRGATVIGTAGSPQKVASRGPQVAIM